MKRYRLVDPTWKPTPASPPIIVSEEKARRWWSQLTPAEKEVFHFINVDDPTDRIPEQTNGGDSDATL